jgi:hypothetical protein
MLSKCGWTIVKPPPRHKLYISDGKFSVYVLLVFVNNGRYIDLKVEAPPLKSSSSSLSLASSSSTTKRRALKPADADVMNAETMPSSFVSDVVNNDVLSSPPAQPYQPEIVKSRCCFRKRVRPRYLFHIHTILSSPSSSSSLVMVPLNNLNVDARPSRVPADPAAPKTPQDRHNLTHNRHNTVTTHNPLTHKIVQNKTATTYPMRSTLTGTVSVQQKEVGMTLIEGKVWKHRQPAELWT